MIEKKIYSSWAFKSNEKEKHDINQQIYHELKSKYKVFRSDTKFSLQDGVDCNFSDYDIVIARSAGYNHATYAVYKNTPELSELEIALLCDQGNLCFGYTMEGKTIYVFED